ncbi:arsenic resistance protein [Corynebacterium lubricantis]|uniref:arsenic resistance protein n=1 Tax=Corynebacterium lubricantis TaxID=541095 RepID=UPI000365A857|nr:arsenic resistance protein [Corynebacterium lubricantis]
MREFLDRWQVGFYLAAIVFGLLVTFPSLEWAVEPMLALLIFVTFMAVPLSQVSIPPKFLVTLLAVNFIAVPIVVWLITRPIADAPELLVPAALVLLAPCVDYVIVFCTLAGGAREKLLAATPILLLVQMLALPVLVPLISGGRVQLEIAPFLRAFLLLIVIPLILAAFLQRKDKIASLADDSMVPIMVITLFVVVSAYSRGVTENLESLARVILTYAAFVVVMLLVGLGSAWVAKLPYREAIAVIFSGVTRNSLVVLPIALVLPSAVIEPAVVVVTQTLVELIAMVVMVKLVPKMVQKIAID